MRVSLYFSDFLNQDWISPGEWFIHFVNKLGCQLQVTITFIIRATLLLKVNLQEMKQVIY